MKRIDTFSHYREGKSQMQRFLTELNPDNLELHDFDLFDWLLFANNFASHVNYFDKNDSTTPNGNWGGFFLGTDDDSIPRRESVEYKSLKKQVTELLSQFEQDGSMAPHLTLFICFIKLLDFSKKAFNNLTKRHLDFYYNEILQLEKQDAKSDKVYVIFELAKKAIQERVPEGTMLDGQKDEDGKKRLYRTDKELIGNQTKVVELKSFLNDASKKELKIARNANTLDGLEEKLPEASNYWWPFGYNSDEVNKDNSDFKTLENAKLGFSVASPLLNLKEGERTVTITIDFQENASAKLAAISKNDIENNIKLLCSGEKEWLSGSAIKCEVNDNKKLQLAFTLSKDFPAVVNYDSKVLSEAFQTNFPVVRFLIEGNKYYDVYDAFTEKEIKNVTIAVDVKGVKSVIIENDNGVLNSEKPYYPFTAQPIKGSNFTIKHPEMFEKRWQKASFTINWKNTPDSIKDLYSAYVLKPNQGITRETFDAASKTSIVSSDAYFKANVSVLEKKAWSVKTTNITLFQKKGSNYQTTFSVTNSSGAGASESIRLTLNQSALQDVYPKLYTLALTSIKQDISIPNEPYIPFAEDIELNYTASESLYSAFGSVFSAAISSANSISKVKAVSSVNTIGKVNAISKVNAVSSLNTIGKVNAVSKANVIGKANTILKENTVGSGKTIINSNVQFFHEDAFGQYEKEITTKSIVPIHGAGGELYIGLDAKPNETVSLLIQVLEGSENILADTFEENENIEWSVLSNDSWNNLSDYIQEDETNKFLESGILKFTVPGEINTNNTRFTDGLVWVRAKANKTYDAVCKLQGIYTQAVSATFVNNENNLSHLDNGLKAESISKLVTRVPQVKSVSQPFNSFDGKYKESDEAFYRRVSERLRHKNRAITQWDYEQLILQEFPDVFMAKCLNHTSETSYMAPGFVTLIVVPNIKNKNAFDIYKPRVSRGTLNKIQDYVNELNTLHVKAQVINPNYQEVTVGAKVRFFDDYDPKFYSKQLDEDIKKYISPWAFDNSQTVSFNVKISVNQIVNYIEQLYYVDYIGELKVYVNNVLQTKYLIEVDPKSILVSAKQHNVTIAEPVCI